jgi:hypothetical protein
MDNNKPYQPSNGTEGCWFIGKFCERCIHEKFSHTLNHNDVKCDIMSRSIIHDIKDPEYPKEWIYDDEGKPTCTSWVNWDWNKDDDGNFNDPPPQPEPGDPNQLMLFSEWDEIQVEQPEKAKGYQH